MLGEFVRFLMSRDRRTEPRKRVRFSIWWLQPGRSPVAGQGLEISAAGLAFAMPVNIPDRELNVAIDLPSRRVLARIALQNGGVSTSGDKSVYRFGAKFVGIPADDWDAVVRFVNDHAEPPNKAVEETTEIQGRDDDAYRLLPLAVQRRIVDSLVDADRLARPPEGRPPLLKMRYVGESRRGDGTKLVRVRIYSRVLDADETRSHETEFVIGEDGSVTWQP